MPTEQKRSRVEDLSKKIGECTIAIATDLRGLPVNSVTQLRRELLKHGIEYRVVKNTLAGLAAEKAGHPEFKELLDGTTAIAFGYADPVETARVLNDYVRANRLQLAIRSGVMDGEVLTKAQLTVLVNLPPRDELIARLMGQLSSPTVRLVNVLNAPLVGIANVLNGPLRGLITVLQQRVIQQQ